ncbi:cytochrome c [Polaromonas sp. CG_9.5]|uniref:c-type cytochrome n=1 Tax=Polaromonas sp. CG_9.5 TaxID=3071705 RepID=UPI002E03C423|nr:cytochrome c [Polaromonas sp. CG_9.5]
MTHHVSTLLAVLIASFGFAASASAADETVRPAGYKPITGDAKLGEKLFNDTKLSTNGMSCASCHANHGAFSASFAKPYPHTVAMAKDQLGRKTIHLDEMIQACMVMPMAAKPLPWDSKELAGLTVYVQTLQKTFKPSR